MRWCVSIGLVLLGAMTVALGVDARCHGAERTVRLRLAWGSDGNSKQRWTGQITVEGGILTQLQPLGIEPDAGVALRLEENRLRVAPLMARGFDGCDVTVRADEQAMVRVELKSDQSPQPTRLEATLTQIAEGQLQQLLDQRGSFFLAHRSPGDRLRVVPTRDHLVFDPGESWTLRIQPDLAAELVHGPLAIGVQLRAAGESKIIWQTEQQIKSQPESPLDFVIPCPLDEGAYRLTVSARPQEGFATRFVPGQQAKPVASRDVELVVVDPAAKLTPMVDQWLPVLEIDPANPGWRQRLPNWAQVPRLSERLPGHLPEAIGNVRPVVRSSAAGDLVELPASADEDQPYWQSYSLPVREPGKPHLIEITYPLAAKQHLTISVIEPNTAGRVMSVNRDAGFYAEGDSHATEGEVGVHRFVFWPRTRSPQLLLVNRHRSAPAQYGTIRLLRQDEQAQQSESQPVATTERMVAGYIARPTFAENFGAAQWLDQQSGMSVQSWSTFLDSARRLARRLRYGGYNSVVISVAADGSSLYPSRILNPSPRYDTGLLASSGQDPFRKDVLEMLLRICDREGIKVVPTLQLAAPLPRLEPLRTSDEGRRMGIGWIGDDGQSWLQRNRSLSGFAPYYNPLNERVQAELVELVAELASRYGQHVSMAGVGLQISGEGYGMLPDLTWGVDDRTVASFTAETGIVVVGNGVVGNGPDRFRRRAEALTTQYRTEWTAWRAERLTNFYATAAERLTNERSDLELVLATEEIFAGPALQRDVRRSLNEAVKLEQVLLEHGLDMSRLDRLPNVTALAPYRLTAADGLQQQAPDLRINRASARNEISSVDRPGGVLFYHAADRLRLASFDRISPFGAGQTHLVLATQATATGSAQRREIVTALADGDAKIVVHGGTMLPRSAARATRELLQTLQQLPGEEAEVRTLASQPVIARIYRSNGATTIALINEAPWPVQVSLPLEVSQMCDWLKLGAPANATSEQQAGSLSGGAQTWQIAMKPYDLQAWRVEAPKLRVGRPESTLDDVARDDLNRRIALIESRTGNLNIQRPYAQLQNPGFEREDGGLRIIGWHPRLGSAGAITLDATESHSGDRALRLRSRGAAGVALVSHLFPMPATGQLTVSVYLRAVTADANTRLYLGLEDGEEGRTYRQYTTLGGDRPIGKEWSRYEFSVDDVPLASDGQMRVHFHLTGNAEVLIDDVGLCDLRFDDARRGALAKRIYAARIALEQGREMDCLQLVDEYWSRYLVEYVPPLETNIRHATALPTTTESDETEEEPGIGERLRGWVPRLWR